MSIGNPNPKPPTPAEAEGWMRDVLGELDTEGDAVLARLMAGRKVAGPLVHVGQHWARHDLEGRQVGGMHWYAAERRWRWGVWRAGTGTGDNGPFGASPTWLEADAGLTEALRRVGWLPLPTNPDTAPIEERELTPEEVAAFGERLEALRQGRGLAGLIVPGDEAPTPEESEWFAAYFTDTRTPSAFEVAVRSGEPFALVLEQRGTPTHRSTDGGTTWTPVDVAVDPGVTANGRRYTVLEARSREVRGSTHRVPRGTQRGPNDPPTPEVECTVRLTSCALADGSRIRMSWPCVHDIVFVEPGRTLDEVEEALMLLPLAPA